ncbi:MAG: pyridoxine 5'-phosphate synthase, partial [Chlorobi bacterium]|nr:pyridoxine 5'-phosphate synthase [Chlorobiota bacterium]
AVTTRLDLEMAMSAEMQRIALDIRPELVTLVPEKREELTTEGGFDIPGHFGALSAFIRPFNDAGIAVSIFIEPEKHAIDLAKRAGADIVELHTGIYSLKETEKDRRNELHKIRDAARHAREQELAVVAGHGLNYRNAAPFATIEEIEEVSIGHAIIARAAFIGLEAAVHEMIRLLGGEA